jgi:glycosyltransferase involved in cell wall biosynthesis
MIYLKPMVKSGLGEDTFWTWINRELDNSSFNLDTQFRHDDAVLHYSTVPTKQYLPAKKITLLWELLPEMKKVLNRNTWDTTIEITKINAKDADYRVASTELVKDFYKGTGPIDVIPLGVNTDLFRPMKEKQNLRKKYNLPTNKQIGFWGGTTHEMKGFQNLKQYANLNPDIHWVIVWKQHSEAGFLQGASNFTHVPQNQLAELMNCCDFMLVCGLLRPFFMIEWEAMSCNLPMRNITGLQKDFVPSIEPRNDIFDKGWCRKQVLESWKEYLSKRGINL